MILVNKKIPLFGIDSGIFLIKMMKRKTEWASTFKKPLKTTRNL